MSLTTNLSVSPYFDDFDENKSFYRILFKPGVSVQVRELNQLQTILQNQIEQFGSNIFKSGSIISGVNFTFDDQYNFVRIQDLDLNGIPTIPGAYVGMFTQSDSTGLKARIVEATDGFETTVPDTKTLYIKYVNSGYDNNTKTYTNNEIITITNANNSLFGVSVENGGAGFSNNDSVVFTSAVIVDPLTGSFTVGDTLEQPTTGSRAQIISISNGYFGNTRLVVGLKPLAADLTTNPTGNSYWQFTSDTNVRNSALSATGKLIGTIGRNAEAQPITDAAGIVGSIIVTNIGYGYTVLPHVSIRPINSAANITDFNATAINYAAKVRTTSTVAAAGVGYSMGVTEGYIYQKGFFLKVLPQSVIVTKYTNQPNNVSVVFETGESIISSNIDTSLLDNVTGTSNENAPGADRLKLAPALTVVSSTDANDSDEYYSLVDFNDGKPYKQNQYTAYNEINNELARRTSDESGDYVIDEFLSTNRSIVGATNTSQLSSKFSVVVDPGKAYISGYRVETVDNYFETVDAGIDTTVTNNAVISLNYGNYIRVKEVGGAFPFQTGAQVTFYTSASQYITNSLTSVNTPGGSVIGTARIRSFILESGTPGTADAIYKMYLFNVTVATGANFKDARSVYYNGATVDGVADIVLEQDIATGANAAIIKSPDNSSLLFKSGSQTTILKANNVSYKYRTTNNTVTLANTGILTINYSSIPDEFFPYGNSATLSSAQLLDITVVPSVNVVSQNAATGTVTTGYNSNVVTGSATQFISEFRVGDFVFVEANNISANIDPSTDINTSTDFITVSNNQFSNTTAVVYTVGPGNTAITNLSNNATYYTYLANSSGFKLVSSAGNTTPINIAAGVAENGHQFAAATSYVEQKQIVLVTNNTSMQLNSNAGITSASAAIRRFFPQNMAIPYGVRDGLSANVDVNRNILRLNTGFALRGTSAAAVTATYNIERTNVTPGTKIAKRDIPVTIATATNAGGAVGPWCLGCPDIFRLKRVIVDGVDATQHFYIDHNQNPDFLDLGYLYKDPNSSFPVTSSSVIQVTFDAFTVSSAGYYITPSYVSANSQQQFTVDSKELFNLGSSINTNEIPELNSNKNQYYNLLNTFDFRPIALPTIDLNANSAEPIYSANNYDITNGIMDSNTVIGNYNPSATLSFSSNTDLKFPLPDATVNTNITYYLPRIDSVVVDKRGVIKVLRGISSKIPAITSKPVDTILIDNIYVPDYPSIPKNPDRRTVEILDTRMASGKYATSRLANHIVTNLFSVTDRTGSQPKGYTMSDIGNLERRIKDLEYYVSLSALESSVSSLVIPSSITTSFDRFKYGFFVDDFSTSIFSDVSSPEYSAARAFSDLYPAAENINLQHGDQLNYSLSIVAEQPVVIQDTATYITLPEPCILDSNTPIVVTQLTRQQQNPYEANLAEDTYVAPKFTEFTSEATLYFYAYNDPIFIQVKQAGANLASTSDAIALTSDDVTALREISFFNQSDIVLDTTAPTIAANGYVTAGAGKIVFSHVPASGRMYSIVTKKGVNSKKWRYMLEYPVDSQDYIDCRYDVSPVQATTTSTTTTTTTTTTTSTTTTTTSTTSTTSTTTTTSSTVSTVSTSLSGLYLQNEGYTYSGTSLPLTAHNWGAPGNGSIQAARFDHSNWTAVKAAMDPYYVVDTGTDKLATVYISNSVMADGIRKLLFDEFKTRFTIGSDGGATLVGLIHDLYIQYLNRVPEIEGVYYWVHQLVTGAQNYGQVVSFFSDMSNAILTEWSLGSVAAIEFRYNTTPNVTSSFSITSVTTPTSQAPWSFVRTKNQNSSAGKFENATNGTWFSQYYRASSGSFTPQTEIWQISTTNLLNGLSNRIGRSIPAADASSVLATIYGWYTNTPITSGAVLDGGFGRPPDVDGFVYWCGKYYNDGVSLADLKTSFFSSSEATGIKNGSISYTGQFATGILSQFLATSSALSSGLASPSSTVTTVGTGITTPSTTSSSTGATTFGSAESSTVAGTVVKPSDSITPTVVPSTVVTYTQLPYDGEGRVLFKGSDGQLYTFDPESGSSGAYSVYNPNWE